MIGHWLEAHPNLATLIFTLLVIPFVGAIVNAATRKRTPEEYAALPQRLAGFLRLMSALFPDARKAIDAANQIVNDAAPANPTRSLQPGETTPTSKPATPPPLPPGTGTPLVFLLVAIGAVLSLTPYALCSCSADKPIVKANPEAANCISNKGIRERECVLNAKTEAQADACIANVRATTSCTDGGK